LFGVNSSYRRKLDRLRQKIKKRRKEKVKGEKKEVRNKI
jgi:hypothetical protein